MSKLHILEQTSLNTYNVVVHAPTPAGNNSAGFSWTQVLANAGLAVTRMTVGNGPGQISQNESNQVANGSIIEASFVWQDDPNLTNQQRQDDLQLRATQAIDDVTEQFKQRLKLYGAVVN